LPEVSLAAVIGRADPKWGERPVLLVSVRKPETISDDDLLAPLHGRVASWWIPDSIVRIENMPMASTDKIDKLRLKKEYGRA
jgi:acyl-CoA synthetase (AMP-forming)/AMP-acid ligase II